MSLSSFDERIRGLQRLLVGHADDVEHRRGGPHPGTAGAARATRASTSRSCSSGRAASSSCGTTRVAGADGAGDRLRAGGLPPELDGFSSLMADGTHVPVLLDEAVAALAIEPAGVYVDGTFGRGGHARAILARLGAARTPRRCRPRPCRRSGRARRLDDPRFAFRRAWFSELPDVLARASASCTVDGVLLDLGISSPQIDDASRGFSFRFDGPLDMRMDPRAARSAADFIARAPRARTDGGHPRLW